ncbi:transmembrane sensor [Pedobacter sp. CG_S7]|uniref:FecR family protein n=1 Tax=Pedobacter sp. CG_S7 TaxID=3143930 RepID=UPI003394A437
MNISPYKLSALISKYIQQDLSESERLLLDEWVSLSNDNKQLFDHLIQVKQVKRGLDYLESLDIDLEWKKAKRKRTIKKLKVVTPYLGYAATIIGVLFTLFLFLAKENVEKLPAHQALVSNKKDLLPGAIRATLKLSNGEVIHLDEKFISIPENKSFVITSKSGELNYPKSKVLSDLLGFHTLSVPKTGTYRVVLSDGTKVWLNSMSELKFPLNFSLSNRKVQLTGEAYFEVAKDTSRPFILEVNNNTIEVLGTHFNVNSYNSNFNTTLLEGSVKVANMQGYKILVPGQEANIIGSEIRVKKGNIKKALAWRNNEFYFENESMHQILVEVSNWYGFEINDDRISDRRRFSGNFNRNLKLSEVLKILNSLSGYSFHFDEGEVTVNN